MTGRIGNIAKAIVFGLAVFYVVGMAWSSKGFDFRAYYCAGVVAREGHDPYLAQPLHRCEQFRTDAQMADFARQTVLPAPFPGYAIALIEPLSLLPFRIALSIWSVALVLAIGVAAYALHRLTDLDPSLIFAALSLSVAWPSLGLGEVMPFIFCALALCARCAQIGQWELAALAAGAMLIEPHIGLPVCVSLAIWAPRTRAILAGIALSAAALSIATLGPVANGEYITRVLPYHALAEIGADSQLSLTAVLHALHVNDGTAIAAGAASYAGMSVLGIALGRRLAAFYRTDAFLALTPPALAVVGGTFVHVTQTAVAVPLALALIACDPKYRRVFAAVLVLLCVPWVWLGSVNASPFAYVLVLYVALEALPVDFAYGAGLGVCGIVLLLTLSSAQLHSSAPSYPPASIAISSDLAEGGWARENLRYLSSGTLGSWARRAPTWAGLLLVWGAAVLATSRQRGLRSNAT